MSSSSPPNARPEWHEPLVAAPCDGDDTGWLVTFSDLVLQLFAFVIVAAVCGATPRPPITEVADTTVERVAAADPRAAEVARHPSPSDARSVPRFYDRRTPPSAPARASTHESAPSAFEPATAWAGDGTVTTEAVPRLEGAAVHDTRERLPDDVAALDDEVITNAPDSTVKAAVPAEVAPAPIVVPRAPAAAQRLGALGRYLSAFVVASAAGDDATVTAGDADVRLAFGGRLGFSPGSAELLPRGRALLSEVQRLASEVPDLALEVAGYTDDIPIHTREFPSNLELSLARAARVARELQRDDPALAVRTVALGFGEHHAVAPNDGPENRARNRRVEVRLVPRGQSMP
jgi:flagellar motor protein MotB